MIYPPMPNGKIIDLLDRFVQEFANWQLAVDTSSEYNDNGYIKYRRTWMEYYSLAAHVPDYENHAQKYTGTVERYLVDTEQAHRIRQIKSLEKALQGYRP